MTNLTKQSIIDQIPITKETTFKIINQFKTQTTIKNILQVLKIAKSTYYYWIKSTQKLKTKQTKNQIITERIIQLCNETNFFHGYKKIRVYYNELYQESISERKTKKIMFQNNLQCKIKRPKPKFKYDRNLHSTSNHIKNNFHSTKPYQKLFTDLTEFKLSSTTFHLSCIIDSFNNKIVSFKISKKPNHKLIYSTFNQLPKLSQNCIIHSDRGTVYRSSNLHSWLRTKKLIPSMSAKASPNQNAPIESFFSILKPCLFLKNPNFFNFTYTTAKQIITNFINQYNETWKLAKFNYKSPNQIK